MGNSVYNKKNSIVCEPGCLYDKNDISTGSFFDKTFGIRTIISSKHGQYIALVLILKERIPRISATLGRQFRKPDIFPTTMTGCSSEQKAGLTQSSSAQSLQLPVHTD
jgi:hypothetical protein